MTSPAAPESETPETDAHLSHLNLADGGKIGIPFETVALLKKLERQLQLAQTELKGHMRVEDELKRDLERGFMQGAYARLKVLQAAEYELAGVRVRIAELEKDAARYRWLRSKYWGSDEDIDEINNLHGDSPEGFDAAIDAALKEDRA